MNLIQVTCILIIAIVALATATPFGHSESYAHFNIESDGHHGGEEEHSFEGEHHFGNEHHFSGEEHHFGEEDLGGYHEHEHHEVINHHAPAHYEYKYGVNDPHTKDNKEAWETREGDVVKGSYSLDEPDGSKRIVDYTADKHNGFSAVVKKIGGHKGFEVEFWGKGHDGHSGL